MPQINGGQALIRALEMEGVEVIFGLPGGAILPVYDPIIDSPIRHLLVRHQQGAGHMAEGVAQSTGPPGVAPKNPRSALDWYWPTDAEVSVGLPGYKPTTKGHPRKIKDAAEFIMRSERPVIYAGGGILKARAAEALRELAELCDIHVVTTLMARGSFPDGHPLCLGMPGMHGNYTAVTSMQKADLLITLGARFDDRVTGKLPTFAPEAKIIPADID